MRQISISQARQTLPSLVARVYGGEEFTIVKNKIPAAMLVPVGKNRDRARSNKRILPQAVKLLSHFKGSNLEVASYLRKTAWAGAYKRV